MMSICDFAEAMKTEVRELLPEEIRSDILISDTEVIKINDQRLHGLVFRMPDEEAAPSFYIDDLYDSYADGADISELAVMLADRYAECAEIDGPPETDLSYDAVRDRLAVRLVGKERNRAYLSDKPHMDLGNGLALIADISMDREMNSWRTAVNNEVLRITGADSEAILGEAVRNAAAVDPPMLVDMSRGLFEPEKTNLLDRTEAIPPEDIGCMYVLSNSSGMLGASALFYPDVMQRSAEIIGAGYYVLPSSIHELILVPDSGDIDEDALYSMVREANRTVVEPQDVLSDDVFHYCFESGRLSLAKGRRSLAD